MNEKLVTALDFVINPLVGYISKKRFIRQEIASNILITSDWNELAINPPVKIKKRVQHISLSIECQGKRNQDEFYGILPDGQIIRPEVLIIDNFEEMYELVSNGCTGSHREDDLDIFTVSSLLFSSYPNKLPKDRTFTKIKIRNKQTFLCPKISWVDFDLK